MTSFLTGNHFSVISFHSASEKLLLTQTILSLEHSTESISVTTVSHSSAWFPLLSHIGMVLRHVWPLSNLPCVYALFRLISLYRLEDMFLVSKLVFAFAELNMRFSVNVLAWFAFHIRTPGPAVQRLRWTSNFEVFPPIIWCGMEQRSKRQLFSYAKMFYHFLWCISRQAETSFLVDYKDLPFEQWREKNFKFLGGKTSKFDTWNSDDWRHVNWHVLRACVHV